MEISFEHETGPPTVVEWELTDDVYVGIFYLVHVFSGPELKNRWSGSYTFLPVPVLFTVESCWGSIGGNSETVRV